MDTGAIVVLSFARRNGSDSGLSFEPFQAVNFSPFKGAIMSNKHSLTKAVLAVALAAGVTGVASADDGGMGRFTDSYQYFASQSVDKATSAWRQANPGGVSEQQL